MYYCKLMAALLMGTGAGLAVWSYFNRQRVQSEQYKNLILFATRLRSGILQKMTIPEAILQAARGLDIEKNAETLFHCLETSPTSDLLLQWNCLWETASVPVEEQSEVQTLLEHLVMKDGTTQQQILDRYLQHIEKRSVEVEESWRKQKGVYMKLSTMIGLLVWIVLL